MQETYIELVPRSGESLQTDMQRVESMNIAFQGYNLPELKRPKTSFLTPEQMMAMRQQGELARGKKLALHLRTQERDVAQNIDRIHHLAHHGVDIALLVTGDAFDPTQEPATCAHNVLEGIQAPIENIELAVGADLYMPEWGRWRRKNEAMQRGIVSATFTQPVFHPQVLETFTENTRYLSPEKIYAGITWVTNGKSRDYWQTMNNVPSKYLPSGEADDTIRRNSISQAADTLKLVRQQGYSAYVMLMRGSLEDLQEIFATAENIREY